MRGPDLTAVGRLRSNDYIDRYLRNPKGVNPQARMPAFPELSWRERRAIIVYLKQ
jgi:cbb3-type cytochrome oxidase cytochrome c subunit